MCCTFFLQSASLTFSSSPFYIVCLLTLIYYIYWTMDDLHTSSTPENSVVYRGFVISSPSRPPPNLAEISGFRQACLNSLGHRLAGYIWQEESFNLTAVERTDIAGN